MHMDGEAVQQPLTAVWCSMRHLREYDKRGNDLEEVERVSGMVLVTVRPPSGSSFFCVVGAAGVASRHAAVSVCGTVSPSDLAGCLSDVGTCMGVIRSFSMDYSHRPA